MKKIIIILTALLMVSCTGSRYSSESTLGSIDFENIDSVSILRYGKSIKSDTTTSYSTLIYTDIIDTTKHLQLVDKDSLLKNKIMNLFYYMPDSKPKYFLPDSLMSFKKRYLKDTGIDTLDIDSIYNMPRSLRKIRNIVSFEYTIKIHFRNESEESIYFYNEGDNVISYSFCCENRESWINKNLLKHMKNYSKYSREYILDIEFQKRFVHLFNDILAKYNETNGTDYPLLDVDYEVWSGIISAP
ncbi:MAG: hypothetical protein ACE364_00015 [Chlorobiota bacterium]